MDPQLLTFLRFFPIFSLLFTGWVCYINVLVCNELTLTFIFLTIEFYLNWLIVVLKNNPWKKNKLETRIELIGHRRLWFCPKCKKSGPNNVEHCPLCKKCVDFRDHHCFFLGTCINHRNAKQFIFVLFYTILICLYVLFIILTYLNEGFQRQHDLSKWDLMLKFFYPVMFGHWLSGKEDFFTLTLVTTFYLLVSIGLSSLVYGVYQTYRILSGKMFEKFRISSGLKNVFQNYKIIFGTWGFLNILLPIPFSESQEIHLDDHSVLISKYN